MNQAAKALAHAQEAVARRNCTIGVAINASSPHYALIEKMDEYRIYHYPDKSYIMTYVNGRKGQSWLGPNLSD